MPRVMFTVSYGIKPDQRSTFLALIAEVKNYLVQTSKKNYAVYEVKGKKNHFTEVYMFASEVEFDSLDDNPDERLQDLLSKLEGCVDDEGMKYTTLIEIA